MIFLFTIIRRHTSLVSDWSSDVFSSDLRRFGGALEQMTLRVYGEAVTTSDESATESAGAGQRYLERRLRARRAPEVDPVRRALRGLVSAERIARHARPPLPARVYPLARRRDSHAHPAPGAAARARAAR